MIPLISTGKRHLLKSGRLYLLLHEEEKSAATVEKYFRDTTAFVSSLAKREVTKALAIAYKQKLMEEGYAVHSSNSIRHIFPAILITTVHQA